MKRPGGWTSGVPAWSIARRRPRKSEPAGPAGGPIPCVFRDRDGTERAVTLDCAPEVFVRLEGLCLRRWVCQPHRDHGRLVYLERQPTRYSFQATKEKGEHHTL